MSAEHSPLPTLYACGTCGWEGLVNTRPRCLACHREQSRRWRAKSAEHRRAYKREYERAARAKDPKAFDARKRKYRTPAQSAAHFRPRRPRGC